MANEHTKHGLYDLRLWGTEKVVSLFELNEVNATSFNSDVLEADCTNSKMLDKLTEQGIARTGLWSPFTGTLPQALISPRKYFLRKSVA